MENDDEPPVDRSAYQEEEAEADERENVPWSDSFVIKRIADDRKELTYLVCPVREDPRMVTFVAEYEKLYKQLTVCNTGKQQQRRRVRDLKANRGVSQAKAACVEEIYANTDDRVAQLRREVNIVYHQLIELQEQEDRTKAELSSIFASIKEMRDNIKMRESELPQNQLRLKAKMEDRLEDLHKEKDIILAENDRLRERINECSLRASKLDAAQQRVETKISETQKDMAKVAASVAKESAKRTKVRAGLESSEEMLQGRQKDIADLKVKLRREEEEMKVIKESATQAIVKKERFKNDIKQADEKVKKKGYELLIQMNVVNEMETEVEQRQHQLKKRENELAGLKNQTHQLDHIRRNIRTKQKDLDTRKEKVVHKKDSQKKRNQRLIEEIEHCKKQQEILTRQWLDSLKLRDSLRKTLMKEKSIMDRDVTMRILHMLANKRLQQDNRILVAQGDEQKEIIRKLELERDNYFNQYLATNKKIFAKNEDEKKWMDTMMRLLRKTAEEEMKLIEMQNLYEVTRNEHVLYTRHILQMRDLIQKLTAKSTFLSYEAQKLVLERNYRDECILKETLALAKVSRQNFIIKANLLDLKESNARTKLIVENQDLEEKKLVKMVRVMKQEKLRETTTLARVVRDMDGLDLALIRRTHELHELYKAIKLRQSLAEKGENQYNIRWKEHQALTTKLAKTKALRRLDQKKRKILDILMGCVTFMQNEIETIHLRSKGLSEELSHPRNIHRWRSLLGRDPEAYQSVRNMHKVRHQIQDKVEETSATIAKIHALDAEYIAFSRSLLTQPSPETVLQLKVYKQDLTSRLGQIKRLTCELRFVYEEKKDTNCKQQIVQRKLKEIREVWIQHMLKERKRANYKPPDPLATLKGPSGPLGLGARLDLGSNAPTDTSDRNRAKSPFPNVSGVGPATSPVNSIRSTTSPSTADGRDVNTSSSPNSPPPYGTYVAQASLTDLTLRSFSAHDTLWLASSGTQSRAPSSATSSLPVFSSDMPSTTSDDESTETPMYQRQEQRPDNSATYRPESPDLQVFHPESVELPTQDVQQDPDGDPQPVSSSQLHRDGDFVESSSFMPTTRFGRSPSSDSSSNN